MLVYRHGLRVGELVALRWEQVDLTAGLLHVTRLKRGLPSTHPLRGPEIRALRRLQREQRSAGELACPFDIAHAGIFAESAAHFQRENRTGRLRA